MVFKEGSWHEATLSVEGNLLIIEHEDHKSIVPISIQEWKEGEKYYLNIPLEGRGRIGLVEELREVFGYYNIETLRKKIDEGELKLVAYFDNGKHATCGIGTLGITVPSGAEVLEYVMIRSYFKFSESMSDEDVKKIKEASGDKLGEYGEDAVREAIESGKLSDVEKAKLIKREVLIKDVNRRVDLVFMAGDSRLIIVEVKTTTISDYFTDYLKKALKQLEEYKMLFNEHGLDLSDVGLGIKNGGDIKAYVGVSVYFDIENKEVRIMWDALPED